MYIVKVDRNIEDEFCTALENLKTETGSEVVYEISNEDAAKDHDLADMVLVR